VPQVAGDKLRYLWGVRGIAFANGKVYVGTHDGRLIAIDAWTGKQVWSVKTIASRDLRIISGPPLAFKGKVMIGQSMSDVGNTRGYVTAYDGSTGRLLWRFFTVPGNPARGFENEIMKVAAKTWNGEWWKYGGGGAVWNAMTYDPVSNRVYIGTSNGSPWNRRLRSPGGGDNLFLCSIIALDADTGAYVWHYQTNPGDTWDYDATNDIELADLVVDGSPRRVLMQASKNGFFYVIDSETGKLLSAEKFARVTWAEKIDLKTGRPTEAVNSRYDVGETTIWPGLLGAHGPQPMAYSATSALAYVPVYDGSFVYSDSGLDAKTWKPSPLVPSSGLAPTNTQPLPGTSWLLAWNPVKQRPVWRVPVPGLGGAGIAATAGNLVFQGRCDGKFVAYAADTGKELWSFDTQIGIVGAPITYRVGSQQYVSVMAGVSGYSGCGLGSQWDPGVQPRRLLTFALDGKVRLPPAPPHLAIVPVHDSEFKSNAAVEKRGYVLFEERCGMCHGDDAVAGGTAPDLRASGLILTSRAFTSIVKRGALVQQGMPRFGELRAPELESIRQYLRGKAAELGKKSTTVIH